MGRKLHEVSYMPSVAEQAEGCAIRLNDAVRAFPWSYSPEF